MQMPDARTVARMHQPRSDPRSGRFPRRRRPGGAPALALFLAALLAMTSALAAAAERRQAPSGQDVTIIEGEKRTVYEYRRNGELRMVKVEPKVGRPYYLVPADDTRGYGNLEEADMLIPRWILFRF